MQVSCYSKLVVTTTLGQSEVFMILVHHLSPLNYLGPRWLVSREGTESKGEIVKNFFALVAILMKFDLGLIRIFDRSKPFFASASPVSSIFSRSLSCSRFW